MSQKRHIYLLDPQILNPETIAVTFAKTSRSPQSFREIAAELTDDKSAKFHEKWVVGYGHASVAEHAVLHIAVENISRLAVECLESNRLASYTEKSTRYQKWDLSQFFIPPELENHPLKDLYIQTCQILFDTYSQSLPLVKKVVQEQTPQRENESEAAWEQRIRSDYIDVCRFLLPAASLANVGMTINARNLEHALTKMLSHPLEEVKTIGAEIKDISQTEIPTLIKYANPNPYLMDTCHAFCEEAAKYPPDTTLASEEWCRLVKFDSDAETRVLASVLYRFSALSYAQCMDKIQKLSLPEQEHFCEMLLGKLGSFDIPLRELEHVSYTFDLILDQGAYFELKRHRMMTQTPQALTTRLGYTVPQKFIQAGFEKQYRSAMEIAGEVFEKISAINPDIASYIVPNGYNRRILITFNLRTAFHFLSLRTAPKAHFSIRRIAYRMAECIQQATPLLSAYIKLTPDDSWQDIENQNFFIS